MVIPLHEFTERNYTESDKRFVGYTGHDDLLDLLDPDEILWWRRHLACVSQSINDR